MTASTAGEAAEGMRKTSTSSVGEALLPSIPLRTISWQFLCQSLAKACDSADSAGKESAANGMKEADALGECNQHARIQALRNNAPTRFSKEGKGGWLS